VPAPAPHRLITGAALNDNAARAANGCPLTCAGDRCQAFAGPWLSGMNCGKRLVVRARGC